MTEVPIWRLNLMRAMYLVMAVGLALTVWPIIVDHDLSMPRMTGVALAMLGTIGVLAVLGLRYPLQMLPLLLFELVWKILWLAAFALPLWSRDMVDEAHAGTIFDTSLGAVLLLVIPWGYVWRHYVKRRPARWS